MKEKLLRDPIALLRLGISLVGWAFIAGTLWQQFGDVRKDLEQLKKGQAQTQARVAEIGETIGRQDERIKAQGDRIGRMEKE